MTTKPYCYLNGEILPVEDAKVSIYDIGILRGYGIYEALQTINNKPLFLEEHLERFRNSTAGMKLKIPISDKEITDVIFTLIEKNGYRETNIRMILTGGQTINAISYDYNKPTFFILAEENIPLDPTYYEHGAKVITFEHQRLYPEFKTTNYITAVNLQPLKQEKGALEILYTHNGKILEASTSNFFLVQGDVIVTAKVGVLPGITKLAVLKAIGNKFEVQERDVLVQEFGDATEAFLTASYKDVVPVVTINDKTVGRGVVGEITKEVMRLFRHSTLEYMQSHY
jgi:branched-chain amino acid aminotransferase